MGMIVTYDAGSLSTSQRTDLEVVMEEFNLVAFANGTRLPDTTRVAERQDDDPLEFMAALKARLKAAGVPVSRIAVARFSGSDLAFWASAASGGMLGSQP